MSSQETKQLDQAELEELGLTVANLEAIRQDFIAKTIDYQESAQYVTNMLLKVTGAHSVRYRTKKPNRLIDKIIRKKKENRKRNIALDTYEREMTDLAGIRVLHLFKGDWQLVHNYITKTWKLKEKPIAYYRQGDSVGVLKMYTEQSCRVKQHPAGYRSVHYVIELSSTRTKRYIEIQVRTIFEEGWSEVDHKIRYPDFSDNPLTNSLLLMLNRIAGSADEMSEFVKDLNNYILSAEQQYQKIEVAKAQMETEKNQEIKKLEAIIANGKLSREETDTLQNIANNLSHGANPLRELQESTDTLRARIREIKTGRFTGDSENFFSRLIRQGEAGMRIDEMLDESNNLRNNLELVDGRLTNRSIEANRKRLDDENNIRQ